MSAPPLSETSSHSDDEAGSGGAPAPSTPSAGASAVSFRNIVWPLLLSLAVLGVVGYLTFDPEAFLQTLHDLNPWLLVAAVATVVLRVFFGAWRLRYFARGYLGMPGSIRSQLAWDFFAYVTPSTVGGGPFAAVFIARDRGIPVGDATSIILFSMLVDQVCFALTIPVLLVAAVYLDVFPSSLGTIGYWSMVLFFVGFLLWVLIFGYSTLFRPQLLRKLVDRLFRLKWLRRFQAGALSAVDDLAHRSSILRSQSLGFYMKGFILTLLPWINRYLLSLFIIWGVYPEVDKLLVFVRSAALNLGSIALPTPGGAGGAEGLYALFLGPPLVPEPLVAPTLLVWRLLSYYIFIAVGFFITMHHVQKTIRQKTRTQPASEVPASTDRPA